MVGASRLVNCKEIVKLVIATDFCDKSSCFPVAISTAFKTEKNTACGISKENKNIALESIQTRNTRLYVLSLFKMVGLGKESYYGFREIINEKISPGGSYTPVLV